MSHLIEAILPCLWLVISLLALEGAVCWSCSLVALKFFVTGEKVGDRKDGVSWDLLILLLTGYCCLVSVTTVR